MIIVVLFGLGLCLGSFVNAWVWRVYMQSNSSPKKSKSTKSKQPVSGKGEAEAKAQGVSARQYSILHGRSMCVHCKHELAWYDLLPVVSWALLRGKCRYCKVGVSWQYPLVELATATLFVLSYIVWPTSLTTSVAWMMFGLWLLILTVFMALLVYDLRWMILPNPMMLVAVALVAVHTAVAIATGNSGILHALAMLVASVLVAGGVFCGLFQISDGRWIGGGDVKLGFVIGVLLYDPFKAFLVLFLASTLGSLIAVPGLLLKRLDRKSHLPFGPFLIVATIITYVFGASIIAWYKQAILLR
ncbi:prepilin peptidase [Candidatus Saccharibacteria bacterium]|nr:prepilin peptidase [Candidatus Saccharibacteria bacterium]